MERDAQGGIRPLYWEAIQAFSLMDDVFMTAVFQDSLPCVDLVIQIILNRPDLHATRVVTQDTIKNLQGHDVRLDIHAVADGQEFNIEIQRDKKGASERRRATTAALWMRMPCARGRIMHGFRNPMLSLLRRQMYLVTGSRSMRFDG